MRGDSHLNEASAGKRPAYKGIDAARAVLLSRRKKALRRALRLWSPSSVTLSFVCHSLQSAKIFFTDSGCLKAEYGERQVFS